MQDQGYTVDGVLPKPDGRTFDGEARPVSRAFVRPKYLADDFAKFSTFGGGPIVDIPTHQSVSGRQRLHPAGKAAGHLSRSGRGFFTCSDQAEGYRKHVLEPMAHLPG